MRASITPSRYSILLALMFCITVPVAADSPWPRPRRSTSDRDADLIDALIGLGRFDDASAICDTQLRSAEPNSDDAGRWRVRQSEVALARRWAAGELNEKSVDELTGPLKNFLSSYPMHRRALFLQAQVIAIEQALARHDVTAVAVSPTDESAIGRAFKRLARVTSKSTELSAAAALARTGLESQREEIRDFGLIADLTRLQQQLLVDTVSMAVLQTELFPSGSRDRITAAARAEQAADEAADKLPADSQARFAVERLKVLAILESGQFQRAESELARLYRTLDPPVPPNIEALRVRIDLAQNRTAVAGNRLDAFYGSSPADAPRSVEMDLAYLEFLLAQKDQGSSRVGSWLDMVQRRSGSYARRRAEAIALARLRSSGSSQPVDPSLVAAQGQDWLRRGQPGRAGELLSAAALAETDGDRAIRLASEAAAALMAAGRSVDAAKILSRVAMSKPQAAGAAPAQLQAAILYAESDGPDTRTLVEASLRSTVNSWPKSDEAKSARQWLLKRLSSQGRHVDAAEVATIIPADSISESEVSNALALWRHAIQSSDVDSMAEVIERFQKSFRPLLNNEQVAARYRTAAAYLLDMGSLAALPARRGELVSEADRFADRLIEFRSDGALSAILSAPPDARVSDATWRLMVDGRDEPRLRERIATLVTTWPGNSQPSMEQIERLIWMGKTDEAIAVTRALVKASNNPGETIRKASLLFGSSDDAAAQSAAIRFWDEIAAGIPQGSERWHEAKLESIALLGRMGQWGEAGRRAKYVLLTSAPRDEKLKQRYESAAKR